MGAATQGPGRPALLDSRAAAFDGVVPSTDRAYALDMVPVIKRQSHRDVRGRSWTISLVPVQEAAREDARFWWEELSPEQRVEAVHICLESALKAQGIPSVPRLRRTVRIVKRRGR
jgi:hypothetical protein